MYNYANYQIIVYISYGRVLFIKSPDEWATTKQACREM